MKNLEDACDELTLADDDVKIPYYIGEVFVYQDIEKTQVFIIHKWKWNCNSKICILTLYVKCIYDFRTV